MIKSFKNRVLAFLLLVVITIACTVFPLNYMYRKQDSLNQSKINQLNGIYINFIKDLNNISEFLSFETTNLNFFITGESQYLKQHEIFQDSINAIFELWLQSKGIFNPLEPSKIQEMQHAYNAICLKFDSMVYLIYKRGYRDLGIEGEMVSYLYHAEKNARFKVYSTDLRIRERDYLNRNDSMDAAALDVSIKDLTNKVNKSSGFNTEEKNRILVLLENYQRTFTRLAAIDRILGLKTNRGLKYELLGQGIELEAMIDRMVTETQEGEVVQSTRMSVIFIGLTLILLLGTIILSTYFSRHLVSHLEKLTHYVSQLAAHNFNYTDEKLNLSKASREIREIYSEFRQMVAQLRIREKQRDNALTEVLEEERRYRELTDLLPQGIFETDKLGNLVYVNKAWYKAFGYIQSDIQEGLNLIEILQTNTENNLFGIDKVENSDYIAIRKDGRRFPALVYSNTIVKNDAVTGRRGIIIDSTLRNRYIETLQKETERAVNSDKLKSSFLANMSHEIRTPMNSIIGFSNLLSAEQVDEDQKMEFIRYIQSSGKILLNLIDDIIDIAKIEAGAIKIKQARCEPKRMIHELISTFEGYKLSMGKQDIAIRCNMPTEEIVFKTDPFRLRQILTNLISNAIKYTEKGSVTIEFNIKSDRFIEFSVEDTGLGMTKEEMNVIFSKFQRTSISEEKNISGTGLGLTISKNLVELLGGQMWVTSIPGEGTRFWFNLPFTRIFDTSIISQSYKENEGNKYYNWKGRTILVAEDDDNSFIYLKEILIRTNAGIVHAVNGKEAIEAVKLTGSIDLILMDIQMPIMDGYSAAKEIKKIRPGVPIIAQTAYAMDGDKEKSILAGCDDYLTKPIDPAKLLDKISQFLPSVVENRKKEPVESENNLITDPKKEKE